MEIRIGNRTLGPGHPCWIVAEIGSNHNRDLATAKRMIDASAEAGLDAVKFQFYSPEGIIPGYLTPQAYGWTAYPERSALEVFQRYIATPADWFPELSDYAAAKGLMAFAAVHDETWARRAIGLGFPALKTASMEITNLPLIRQLARFGVPLILSTGMAHPEEIEQAVQAARQEGNSQLMLLHCVANYPSKPEEFNLRQIAAMRKTFGVPVGFSDHSLGHLASMLSITQGACMIEKHLTLDRKQQGPDHPFAMQPEEFAELVRSVRAAEAAMGTGDLNSARPDEGKRKAYLRSVVAARALRSGQVLTAEDLTTKRPGHGIPPREMGSLIGRTVQRDLTPDEVIARSDVR